MANYNFKCGTCRKVFTTWEARENHLRTMGHQALDLECDRCARCFDSEAARFSHMDALNHFEYECSLCKKTWPTYDQQLHHEYSAHHYCAECNEAFILHDNLKKHLKSKTHRNSDIQCPVCREILPTATGITHHVETGACPYASNINRDRLRLIIRDINSGGQLTTSRVESDSKQCDTTARSYNPDRQGWECYICQKLFKSLSALNNHTNSPAHQDGSYSCPNQTCKKEFETVAAFISHLETESCGCKRFKPVQPIVKSVIKGYKRIEF